MRVALFGGSFNPPHVGHQLAALYVLETGGFDELWFVPCFRHPFDKPLEAFELRLEMARRTADPLGPRARVDEIERDLGGTSKTLRTVKALRDRHPAAAFSLVIGADLAAERDSWHGAAELKSLVGFTIVGRQGREGPEGPLAMPEVSSTEIRERLARGLSVESLVPRGVLDFIRERKLYGAGAHAGQDP
jgi:nicotinate-nucleotide adenylyltransferase